MVLYWDWGTVRCRTHILIHVQTWHCPHTHTHILSCFSSLFHIFLSFAVLFGVKMILFTFKSHFYKRHVYLKVPCEALLLNNVYCFLCDRGSFRIWSVIKNRFNRFTDSRNVSTWKSARLHSASLQHQHTVLIPLMIFTCFFTLQLHSDTLGFALSL